MFVVRLLKYFPITQRITCYFSVGAVAEPPRRKALPAWIRDGLSKMDKNKTENTDLSRRPKATEVTGYNTMMNRGATSTAIQRNKISGYSVLNDSDASSDEKVIVVACLFSYTISSVKLS